MESPRIAGDLTVFTPAASSAENLSSAVPLPPEIIAPACCQLVRLPLQYKQQQVWLRLL